MAVRTHRVLEPEPALPRTAAEADALKREVEELARQLGEVKAKLARALSRLDDEQLWQGAYVSLTDYANQKLSLTAGETKELVRVYRKLQKMDVPCQRVIELGWPK